jgi:hypothetical protein
MDRFALDAAKQENQAMSTENTRHSANPSGTAEERD